MRPVDPFITGGAPKVTYTGPEGVEPLVVAVTESGLVSEWEFDAVERAAILAGANLRLGIFLERHPVVWMEVRSDA